MASLKKTKQNHSSTKKHTQQQQSKEWFFIWAQTPFTNRSGTASTWKEHFMFLVWSSAIPTCQVLRALCCTSWYLKLNLCVTSINPICLFSMKMSSLVCFYFSYTVGKALLLALHIFTQILLFFRHIQHLGGQAMSILTLNERLMSILKLIVMKKSQLQKSTWDNEIWNPKSPAQMLHPTPRLRTLCTSSWGNAGRHSWQTDRFPSSPPPPAR